MKINPETRKEMYYDAILNGGDIPNPITREELYLAQIAKQCGGGSGDLSNYYTRSQTDQLIFKKVDKIQGMGLSENNFTNVEKIKLSELENYDDTEIKKDVSALSDYSSINRSTLGYTRKNALKVTASATTKDGVTMTVNPDGTLTLSGTATVRTVVPITPTSSRNPISDLPAKFILSGGDQMLGVECCIGVEISTNAGSGYIASFYDGDNGRLVDLSAYPTAKYWYAYMRIYEGVNVDGITIYPMIRPSDISNADFESYKPSLMDYISNLEKRIAALEGGKA